MEDLFYKQAEELNRLFDRLDEIFDKVLIKRD
jgi:hypothetical protein